MKSYHKNYKWRLGFPAKGKIVAPKVLVFFTNFRFFREIPHRLRFLSLSSFLRKNAKFREKFAKFCICREIFLLQETLAYIEVLIWNHSRFQSFDMNCSKINPLPPLAVTMYSHDVNLHKEVTLPISHSL